MAQKTLHCIKVVLETFCEKREEEIFLPSTPFVCQFAEPIFIWFDSTSCLNMKLGVFTFDLKKIGKMNFSI